MKTRSLARPVVLLLSFGVMHGYFKVNGTEEAPVPKGMCDIVPRSKPFEAQKAKAFRRAKRLALAVVVGVIVLGVIASLLLLKQ